MNNIILFAFCFTLSGIGAWFLSIWGVKLDLVDKPTERSSHSGIVPNHRNRSVAGFQTAPAGQLAVLRTPSPGNQHT